MILLCEQNNNNNKFCHSSYKQKLKEYKAFQGFSRFFKVIIYQFSRSYYEHEAGNLDQKLEILTL